MFYPPKISEKLQNPKNAGKIADANAVGISATFTCGAVLRFTLQIKIEDKKIQDVKFQTDGCGYLIAAANILTEKVIGRNLTDLHGLEHYEFEREIESELGGFPINRAHCLELSLSALQNALADFRAKQVEEFSGEKALICSCFGVSEETIEQAVAEKSLETVEAVSDVCNAGDGCGACRLLIQEIIDTHRQERF